MQIIGAGPPWLFLLLRLCEVGLTIMMTVFWLRSMHRAIETCHHTARTTEPGTVWLVFIPLFGLVWQFIAVQKTGETLAREYRRRNWSSEEGLPGVELGMIACIVVCVVFILRMTFNIHPGLGFVGSMAVGFCMYRHMDRVNAYCERMNKETDPTVAFGQIPLNYQPFPPPWQQQPYPQQNYQQPPVYPQQGNFYNPYYPPAQQQQQGNFHNPYYPPPQHQDNFHNPYYPQQQQQPPVAPENNPPQAPDEFSRWMPKKDEPRNDQP